MAHLLQDKEEFDAFCKILVDENVRSYLEIGSFSGGSIQMVAAVLPKGSRIVSVDMPEKVTKGIKLREVLTELRRSGYDTHLILGDSTLQQTVDKAAALGPYDAVFIDGNHTKPYVKSDWKYYGPMARIVGFHDVARDKPPHGAALFWNIIKRDYRHAEFISERTRQRTDGAFGIGVVWRC